MWQEKERAGEGPEGWCQYLPKEGRKAEREWGEGGLYVTPSIWQELIQKRIRETPITHRKKNGMKGREGGGGTQAAISSREAEKKKH